MRRLVPVATALSLAGLAAGCGGGEVVGAQPENAGGGATTTQTTTSATTSGGQQGDAKAGRQVFLTAGCTSCHTLKDAGSTGTVGPNLDDAKPP